MPAKHHLGYPLDPLSADEITKASTAVKQYWKANRAQPLFNNITLQVYVTPNIPTACPLVRAVPMEAYANADKHLILPAGSKVVVAVALASPSNQQMQECPCQTCTDYVTSSSISRGCPLKPPTRPSLAQEPSRQELVAYEKGGRAPPRRALAIMTEAGSSKPIEVVVDLHGYGARIISSTVRNPEVPVAQRNGSEIASKRPGPSKVSVFPDSLTIFLWK